MSSELLGPLGEFVCTPYRRPQNSLRCYTLKRQTAQTTFSLFFLDILTYTMPDPTPTWHSRPVPATPSPESPRLETQRRDHIDKYG